jgi:hypothetical protein
MACGLTLQLRLQLAEGVRQLFLLFAAECLTAWRILYRWVVRLRADRPLDNSASVCVACGTLVAAWTVDRNCKTPNRPDGSFPMSRDFVSLSFSLSLHTVYCLLFTPYFSLAIRNCPRDEPLKPRSQSGSCTPVDIRSKKARKFSLFLTFQPARRDPDVSALDPQTLSCQEDRT